MNDKQTSKSHKECKKKSLEDSKRNDKWSLYKYIKHFYYRFVTQNGYKIVSLLCGAVG